MLEMDKVGCPFSQELGSSNDASYRRRDLHCGKLNGSFLAALHRSHLPECLAVQLRPHDAISVH